MLEFLTTMGGVRLAFVEGISKWKRCSEGSCIPVRFVIICFAKQDAPWRHRDKEQLSCGAARGNIEIKSEGAKPQKTPRRIFQMQSLASISHFNYIIAVLPSNGAMTRDPLATGDRERPMAAGRLTDASEKISARF
jgi:hypothetical protein